MNIKVDFDNIVVKEDKNDFNVKVLMLKGEKGDAGEGEANIIETVQVNGTALPVTNKTVNVPVPIVDSAISSSSTNPVQNSAIYTALSNKVDTSELTNYYETSEVDNLLNDKVDNSVLDNYYTKTQTYNKSETDALLDDKADATTVDAISSQISGLASGSPLVANSINEMTDTSKVYVNTSNGNWYYYNGSSWISGGTYQSSGIEDGSITPKKTNFLPKQLNELNVFNPEELIDGYYVGASITPIAVSGWGYYQTDDLVAGETYTLGGDGHIIISCFYGTTNVLLQDSASNRVFNIPSTATSIFISSTTASKNNIWITKGGTAFNYKTDYKKDYIIDENIINMKKYKYNYKIVDKNGNGHYTTLTEAVANSTSGDVLIVYPGIYNNEEVQCWGKTLNIIGINRDTCIIKNNYCDYDRPPIEFSVGILKNLTFISEYNETNYNNVSGWKSYAIHVEDDYQQNKTMLIENCCFESQCNYAVGLGTRGGCNVEFNNCIMKGNNPVSGQGGLYFHDASNSNYAGVQNVSFINNRVLTGYNGSSTDLRIESQGTVGSTVNVEFINNIVINNATGTITNRFVDHASGAWKTNFDDLTNFNLTYSSFGNNDTKINK